MRLASRTEIETAETVAEPWLRQRQNRLRRLGSGGRATAPQIWTGSGAVLLRGGAADGRRKWKERIGGWLRLAAAGREEEDRGGGCGWAAAGHEQKEKRTVGAVAARTDGAAARVPEGEEKKNEGRVVCARERER